ncbi:hypothetical protein EVAR_11290_1 [Eumeta japonica]|uniref:Uncharacterized protein n=1 Tax=Eumeta variegata TaxID=151549 RepID=A0A4C1UMF5_EUMVA|nr:hypothetical protein EVAR_11290_1 [Eumeta japonica]
MRYAFHWLVVEEYPAKVIHIAEEGEEDEEADENTVDPEFSAVSLVLELVKVRITTRKATAVIETLNSDSSPRLPGIPDGDRRVCPANKATIRASVGRGSVCDVANLSSLKSAKSILRGAYANSEIERIETCVIDGKILDIENEESTTCPRGRGRLPSTQKASGLTVVNLFFPEVKLNRSLQRVGEQAKPKRPSADARNHFGVLLSSHTSFLVG